MRANRLSPFSRLENPALGRRARPAGFTLIEMLVSMVVVALLILAMMTLVESATNLWRDSEGRTDAYREARAALLVMGHDLENAVAGTTRTT